MKLALVTNSLVAKILALISASTSSCKIVFWATVMMEKVIPEISPIKTIKGTLIKWIPIKKKRPKMKIPKIIKFFLFSIFLKNLNLYFRAHRERCLNT